MSDSSFLRVLCASVVPLCFLQDPAADPARELASRDPELRLAAVRTLAEQGHPDAEKLLLKALKDDDWEIVAIAASELGELASKKALDPLLELALEGPTRGLRRSAAEALRAIDAPAAGAELSRKLSGAHAEAACEARASLAPALDGTVKTALLQKRVQGKESATRAAAARALVALAGEARAEELAALLAHEDLAVRALALEGAGAAADPATLAALLELLGQAGLQDVLERRTADALRAICAAHPQRSEELLSGLARVGGPGRARVARVLGRLGGEHEGKRALEPARALVALEPLLSDGASDVRAAGAAALGRVGTEEALARAEPLARSDAAARVRAAALDVLVAARGAKNGATRALLAEKLRQDADPRVREKAAVALGLRGLFEARAALEAALTDPEWGVVTCAAISLGKLGVASDGAASCAALVALHASGADDWRRRASAVAALVRLRAQEGIPTLIAALEDPEPLVARMALEFLRSVAHVELEPKPALWTRWWQENGARVRLALPEAVLEARKRLEYVRAPEEIYAGLDLVVLESRGDHIENVLAGLAIEHRRSGSGRLIADGLSPEGVLVANCTGEVTADEAERIAWFVRAGGALFGSCWALHQTIEAVQPGLVRKLETKGEVLDDVPAHACDAGSPYLEGVFGRDLQPIFHLEGAHLIEVLDPEEVEVLIDSPECAARWGGGNLAAWFRVGHGVVLDSANHFDLQGFLSATGLDDAQARQAYAVDHLGLTLAELRRTKNERYWGRTVSAGENVKDLSVFRVITNFVRWKRLGEE